MARKYLVTTPAPPIPKDPCVEQACIAEGAQRNPFERAAPDISYPFDCEGKLGVW